VNDFAVPVKKIKAKQDLSRNLLAETCRQAFIVVFLDNLKQIHAQDFKDKAKVLAIRAIVNKAVQKLDYVAFVLLLFIDTELNNKREWSELPSASTT